MGTSGYSVKTNAAQNAGVGQLGAGGDDAVCDGVVDGLDGDLVMIPALKTGIEVKEWMNIRCEPPA